jgi:NDP-sugar pyrophosphorylase family protein
MKILLPLAAQDTFFSAEEYHFPKPLVEVAGEPMIKRVIDSLHGHFPDADFVFIVSAADCRQFDLAGTLRQIAGPRSAIVVLDAPTKGAVCSCLLAIDHIDDDDELLIVNGDQVIKHDLADVTADFRGRHLDAGVITFDAVHPRWSYLRTDAGGLAVEAAEKRVISRTAIAGFYYFRRGHLFVQAAMDSIRREAHVNGAYYIAPTLNELILAGLKVGHVSIPSAAYHSLYSPQRVEQYERHLHSQSTAQSARAQSMPAAPAVNVVIPIAGHGVRFARAGYDRPKPFICVTGTTMVENVMANLAIPNAHYILIGRQDHFEAQAVTVAALRARSDVTLVPISDTTEGAACTVLLARRLIDGDVPLLIANCDQIVDMDCNDMIQDAERRGLDGSILVFRNDARDLKWSFARLGQDDMVEEVREKVAISDLATVGIYYFRRGRRFIDAAVDMIAHNDRTNGEFYTCPVYNYAIADGARIGVYEISPNAMHGIGTPEDLTAYLTWLKQV